MEHAFGRGTPFRLGLEEELLLVDSTTLELSHVASRLLPRVKTDAGTVKFDVYEALVETSSPVCANALEAAAALDEMRFALRRAGATLIGSGIHPTGAFGDVVHVDEPRYREITAAMRGLMRRTPTCALHVHVGMPDPETAIRVTNRIRAHLPLLQALAAHSPYWHGRDSGFATARAQLFRAYPRSAVPRELRDYADYEELMAALSEQAGIPDYTHLWWDVRPHPQLGTVEVRAMDAQARIDDVCGLAALVHALVLQAAHEEPREPVPPAEVLTELSFLAGRDGLDATLWWRGGFRPVTLIAADVIAKARPYARDAGAEDALALVERIVREGGGAKRIRAAHAAGGMRSALRRLADETAAPFAERQADGEHHRH